MRMWKMFPEVGLVELGIEIKSKRSKMMYRALLFAQKNFKDDYLR